MGCCLSHRRVVDTMCHIDVITPSHKKQDRTMIEVKKINRVARINKALNTPPQFTP